MQLVGEAVVQCASVQEDTVRMYVGRLVVLRCEAGWSG